MGIKALDVRYSFLPFMYSLAHHAHRHSRPIGHPASFVFPAIQGDVTKDQQYMVGGVLLPADVSTNNRGSQGENSTFGP